LYGKLGRVLVSEIKYRHPYLVRGKGKRSRDDTTEIARKSLGLREAAGFNPAECHEIEYVVRAIVDLKGDDDFRSEPMSEAEAVFKEAQRSSRSVSEVMDEKCRAGYYGQGASVK
jgi:hypothetical protein